ncbi:YncE family protein [Pseudomonas iridis]|uniref:YncE family protein n=1 Tax=Pseudomonas iridis TaxID=2710587 RepID=UPI0021C0360C|nr:YncE family protein [Pseudomonas iridis]MCT8945935.1 YncE family protein [Pseudomonas iridis]
MSVNDLPEDTTLTFKKLDIPGRTGPVSLEPEIWGINRAAAWDNFPRQGLLCRAGPWGVMSTGDAIFIEIDGQPVEPKIVGEHEVGTQLQMFVPSARIDEGLFSISYTVTRLNQVPEKSEALKVLCKFTRPGGHDEYDGPGHSKLIMSIPPEILADGINKENVAAGFPVSVGRADGSPPYPFAAAGDQIQVVVGGEFVLSEPLTQDQADGKIPIIIHIDEATLREAGDSDVKGLAVAFEVYDLVDNRSEDWSFEQRVVVNIDTTRLLAPLLKEAVNNVLDVDKLGTANGTAQIVAVDTDIFKENDEIFLQLRGTPVEGAPIDKNFEGVPLKNVPGILEIPVDNALLVQLGKSQISLSFGLKRDESSPRLRSKTQFISAIGEVQRLAAPVVRDASDGALDPTLEQVAILIPFDKSFVAGQSIELRWLVTRADLTPYMPVLPLRTITAGDIRAKEPLRINVPGDPNLITAEGGKLEVFYLLHVTNAALSKMNRVNATHATRESIHAEVLQVGEPRLELPEPEVAGVVNGFMPPDKDGTTLTVPYLKTNPGDIATYFWFGSKTGMASDSIPLTSITAGKPIPFTIGAGLIKGNTNGMIETKYLIKRAAGGTSYSNPLEFRVAIALELKAPAIKQAPNGSTLDPFAAQDELTAVIDYVGMDLDDEITVTWTGAPGTPAGGSHTTAPVHVTTIGAQEIAINTAVLAFNFGQSVNVHCTVTRNGASKDSEVLLLAVLPIQDQDSRLPSPIINGNTSSELDTTTLVPGAKTRIARWPHIAQGQPLWMCYLKDDDPTPIAITYEATPTPAAGLPNGMYPDTPVAVLKALPDGARVSVMFMVGFDRSPDESKAVTFPVRTYTIKAVEDLKPQITSVKGSPSGDEIPEGGTTVETAVTLTGTAAKGQKVEVFDGATSRGDATADVTTGNWALSDSGLSLTTHLYKAKALYGSGFESSARTFSVVEKLNVIQTRFPRHMGVSPDGARAYVLGYENSPNRVNTIDVIDFATQRVIKSANIENKGVWDLIVSRDGSRLYVSSSYSVLEFNSSDLLKLRSFTSNLYRQDLIISHDASKLYCTGDLNTPFPNGRTEVFDLSSGRIIRNIGLGNNPQPSALSPDDRHLYTIDRNNSNGLRIFETNSYTETKRLEVGQNAGDIVVKPDGTYLYVLNSHYDELIEISIPAHNITRRINIHPGLSKMAITADGKHLCCVGWDHSGEALIIDTSTLAIRTIAAGHSPHSVAFSNDGKRVYICNHEDNTVWDSHW